MLLYYWDNMESICLWLRKCHMSHVSHVHSSQLKQRQKGKHLVKRNSILKIKSNGVLGHQELWDLIPGDPTVFLVARKSKLHQY